MKNSVRKMSLCLAACLLLSSCAAQSQPVNGGQASGATTTTTGAALTDASSPSETTASQTGGKATGDDQKQTHGKTSATRANSSVRQPDNDRSSATQASRNQGKTTVRNTAGLPTTHPDDVITVAGTDKSWLALDASKSSTNRDVHQKLNKVEQDKGVKIQLKRYSEDDLVTACLKANKAGSAIADIVNADARTQYRMGSALQDLGTMENQKWSLTITRNHKKLAVFPAAYATVSNADLKDVQVLFFNKTLLKQASSNEDALYKMVKDGTWTFTAMRKMSSAITKDIDGHPGMTKKDQFGFTGVDMRGTLTYTLFKADGGQFTKWDKNQNLAYAMGDAHNIASMTQMQIWLLQDTSVFNSDKGTNSRNDAVDMFKDGRALFLAWTLGNRDKLSGTKGGWGMVPYPKADKNASYVGTRIDWQLPRTVDGGWSIPAGITGKRLEKAKALVNAMGAQLKTVSVTNSDTDLPMTDVVRRSLSITDTDSWVDVYRDMGSGGIMTLHYLFDNISNKPAARVKQVQDEAERKLASL